MNDKQHLISEYKYNSKSYDLAKLPENKRRFWAYMGEIMKKLKEIDKKIHKWNLK